MFCAGGFEKKTWDSLGISSAGWTFQISPTEVSLPKSRQEKNLKVWISRTSKNGTFPKFTDCIGIALKWSADSRQALDHLVLILPALNMALSCEVAETRCSKKGTFHCLRRWERLGKRCVFSIWIFLGIFHFQNLWTHAMTINCGMHLSFSKR